MSKHRQRQQDEGTLILPADWRNPASLRRLADKLAYRGRTQTAHSLRLLADRIELQDS